MVLGFCPNQRDIYEKLYLKAGSYGIVRHVHIVLYNLSSTRLFYLSFVSCLTSPSSFLFGRGAKIPYIGNENLDEDDLLIYS